MKHHNGAGHGKAHSNSDDDLYFDFKLSHHHLVKSSHRVTFSANIGPVFVSNLLHEEHRSQSSPRLEAE